MDFKYSGIILNKRDVGETDRIYTIFTLESGKIRALGKGVRRPNSKLAGLLEPVTFGEFFVAKKRGLGNITGSIVLNNFSQLKSDWESLRQTAYVFRTLEKLIPEKGKEEGTFNLLLKYLTAVDMINRGKTEAKNEILTIGTLFKIMKDLGYQLEVMKCVACKKRLKAEQNYFSPSRGGVLCSSCSLKESNKIRFENDSIKLIRIFFKNNIDNFKKLSCTQRNSSQFMDNHE